MKIRTKLQLFSSLFLLVLLLIVNVLVCLLFYEQSMEQEKSTLENQAVLLMKNYKTAELLKGDSKLLSPYTPDDGMIRIIDSRLNVLNEASDDDDFKKLPVHFSNDDDFAIVRIDDDFCLTYRLPIPDEDHPRANIEITESLDTFRETMSTLMMIMLGASIVALLLSIIGGRLLSNLLLKPIASMSHTMKDIQESGSFKKIKIEKKSKDELHMMADTFNAMIGQLEKNFTRQQQFLADASHELKTPLTVIESYAKLLKRWGTSDPDIQKEAVDAIYSEAIRMKTLTRQLLYIASEEQEETKLKKESIDLVSFCKKMLQPLRRIHRRTIHIHHEDHELFIRSDPEKLEQVLLILLDNALKYSEKEIDLFVQRAGSGASITVKDYGIGIPENELEAVFDRFYRVDKSRQRKTGGSGLGLSIAKSIVDRLGGTIRVESKEGSWTSFTITLPS